MSFYSRFVCSFLICVLASLCGATSEASEPDTYRSAILGVDPMDAEGLNPQVSHILREYYRLSLGGSRGWEQVESLRFEGVLRVPQGVLHFVAFKKKPDYCKIVLFAGRERIVMSYDGTDAWQLNTMESTDPVSMPPLEALNFIRDAPTAGHLLYAALPGKQVELLGTRRVGEHTCYDLQVTLPDGQQVTYAIDPMDFVERQQIVENAVSGALEVTTHGELQVVKGVSIPMVSTMEADGVFTHEVRMRSVEVNVGAMPWMFSRPSGVYMPGRLPEGMAEADPQVNADLTGRSQWDAAVTLPETGSFGLDAPESAFGETRFPDLDAKTKQSILDDIDDL